MLDITAQREAHVELERLAYSDPLTGLANRTKLEQVLAERTAEHPSTLLYLDLDDFKTVNDSLGHSAGDDLLRTIASRLRESSGRMTSLRGSAATSSRCWSTTSTRATVAERIVALMREPVGAAGHELVVTASVGVAVASDPAEILRHADMAMYDAKKAGGATYRFFEAAMHDAAVSRLVLLGDLARPSFLDELFVDYSRSSASSLAQVVGVEALCRWRHPRRGLIRPGEFLGVAEENGRIVEIGQRVLTLACTQGAALTAPVRRADLDLGERRRPAARGPRFRRRSSEDSGAQHARPALASARVDRDRADACRR